MSGVHDQYPRETVHNFYVLMKVTLSDQGGK